jgi:hypothetical protein
MDTSVEAAMTVHRLDGSLMKFKEYGSGLYYFDTAEPQTETTTNFSSTDEHAYLFLNTVANNKQAYMTTSLASPVRILRWCS